jgi:hypothetical protein
MAFALRNGPERRKFQELACDWVGAEYIRVRWRMKEKAMVAENRSSGSRSKGRELKRSGGGDDELKKTLKRARADAAEAVRVVKSKARAVVRSVKETTEEVAGGVMDAVQEEAERVYDQQKDRVVAGVQKVAKLTKQAAHALRAVKADNAADFVDRASERVGNSTDYLEDHTLNEMVEDAGEVVRRHEAVVVGGLVIAGFALARFLKASASRAREEEPDNSGGGEAGDFYEEEDDSGAEGSAEQDEDEDEREDEDEPSEQDEEEFASSGTRNGAGKSRGRGREEARSDRHSWRER